MYNILSFVTVDFCHTVVDNILQENSRMTETPRSLEERLDELLALQKSQVHDPDAFHPDKDAIGVAAWLELSNTPKTQSRYKQRRQLLGYWAVANGRRIEQVRVRSPKSPNFQNRIACEGGQCGPRRDHVKQATSLRDLHEILQLASKGRLLVSIENTV